MFNWLVFRFLLDYLLPAGKVFQYYDTDTEIYEFISACIILTIGVYFYFEKAKVVAGADIKHALISEKVTTLKDEKQVKSEWITTIPTFPWLGSFSLVRRSRLRKQEETIKENIKR